MKLCTRYVSAVISLVVIMANTVRSQEFFFGSCPTQAVVQNFNTANYLGKWYENRNYFAIFQILGRCVTATYTDQGNGLIGVTNSQVDILGQVKSIVGQAKLANPASTEAKLSVSFASPTAYASNPTAVTPGNYWVLDTDYTSYAVVWTCNDKFFFNTQFLWILTRDRSPAQSVIDAALAVVRNRGLDIGRLEITDQNNCPN